MLQTFLADRDAPCPGCGYNLRGLPGDRCPECNQHLSLRVGLTEPRMGWYLTALIGAAAGLGLSGLLLIYMLIQLSTRNGVPPLDYFAVHNCVGTVLHGSLLWWLARRGPRLRRWTLPARILLAAAMWVLTLFNIVLFSLLVK